MPLVIDAPPSVANYKHEIEAIPASSFDPLLELTGNGPRQDPIRIVIAPERSEMAQSAPPWVSGWAFGDLGLVILVPSRASRYPDDGVDELLRHDPALARNLIHQTSLPG
jgi:hypothetical protein